jgi:hypothetical protein
MPAVVKSNFTPTAKLTTKNRRDTKKRARCRRKGLAYRALLASGGKSVPQVRARCRRQGGFE